MNISSFVTACSRAAPDFRQSCPRLHHFVYLSGTEYITMTATVSGAFNIAPAVIELIVAAYTSTDEEIRQGIRKVR